MVAPTRAASARERQLVVAGIRIEPYEHRCLGKVQRTWRVYVDGHICGGETTAAAAEERASGWREMDPTTRRLESGIWPVWPGCEGLAYTRPALGVPA